MWFGALLVLLACSCGQYADSLRIAGRRTLSRSGLGLPSISSQKSPLQCNYKHNVYSLKLSTLASVPPAQALPAHPELLQGFLTNGLKYIIMPNQGSAKRFEAHLEVLSGSAKELEKQQGMAHLLEHVAYMGSPKRQLISGTGSRTNAYTDFHHTVFYAACPIVTPDNFWGKPMLPMALDALLDVMTTPIESGRLEKERAAVLSEASMVNKMQYRVECQILSALHKENRISKRFPIGKEALIKAWTRDDLQLYHGLHYRPDNVVLYLVGDVEPYAALDIIKQKFEDLKPKLDAEAVFRESKEFPEVSMRDANRHFPPVQHRWSCDREYLQKTLPSALLPSNTIAKMEDLAQISNVFQHELLQTFSFHLFGKCPIEPIRSKESFKREVIRKMLLAALQIRLNVLQRSDPLFTFVDFNYINWPREGCAVTSLDLTTEVSKWKEAVTVAVREIRRFGLFGLTANEFERYRHAAVSEAMQLAAQSEQRGNEEVLAEVMNCEANGHTIIDPKLGCTLAKEIMEELTMEEVCVVAKDLCAFLSHMSPADGVSPVAMVGCAPLLDRDGNAFKVTEDELSEVVKDALLEPLQPLKNAEVPKTLITGAQLAEKLKQQPPHWSPLDGKASKHGKNNIGVIQRKLENGIRVNMKQLGDEPQRVSVRMYIPGGRMLESRFSPGSVVLGTRTMQEGGAFLNMTREEVELFCIDHSLMVDIIAGEDALTFDFQAVTTEGPGEIEDVAVGETRAMTGVEAVMQVAHIILTDFNYEQDAFKRASQSLHEQFDSTVKGLESACHESLLYSLTSGDTRFLTPNHKQIEALSLETVEKSIIDQLDPVNIEISLSGDLSREEMEKLVLAYIGTVPRRTPDQSHRKSPTLDATGHSIKVKTLGRNQQLGVYLPDNDERAMGYIAGPAPNKWGVYDNSQTVLEKMQKKGLLANADVRREHPMFGHACLLVLQEIINRRLFSVVREERQLTYDAAFHLQGFEAILGCWYMVSVTSSPDKVQQAIGACKEALASLKGTFGVMGDSIQGAKRTIVNKFKTDSLTNRFWIENMSGSQVEHIPLKTLRNIEDFESVVNGITVQDVSALVDLFDFNDSNMTSCVGITAPTPPPGMAQQ